ncbi:hypothetical protein CBR_g8391 [Chara braunii]|uniref:Radical SAM core domain-containing protein n=1 Tax=Chara braunii TaxID=69332 RepID=A0A388KM23_CHABU|nr:hypothetical protein CBR_g8391 [Chara braunii]|eukprot:GBG71092.1 hypothetical protein CBR_g8391 [Chara braunii]
MVLRRQLNPQSIFDEEELRAAFEKNDIKPLHIATVWNYVLSGIAKRSCNDQMPTRPNFADIKDLPVVAHNVLQLDFSAFTSEVIREQMSVDGSTTKLLIQLQDGKQVETVIMHHDASAGRYAGQPRGGGPRTTLCVSSQVGCQMACSFCATGTMGLQGNLTAGEIVEQLVHALRFTPNIRNVVFMGMGEPLNNYDAVLQSVRSMCSGKCFRLSPNHITISTVGIIPRMKTLASDLPGVNLALSLHAPSQELRAAIVPAARAYRLDKLVAALDAYQAASGRTVFVEYVMLAGVNDSEPIAHQLGSLLKGRQVFVNLIPHNSVSAATSAHSASSPADVRRFQEVLRESYGLHATVRQEMGGDIAGACGQLVVSNFVTDEANRPTPTASSRDQGSRCDTAVSDIEDLLMVSALKM